VLQVAHGGEHQHGVPLGRGRGGQSEGLRPAVQHHRARQGGGHQLVLHRDTLALGVLEAAPFHTGRNRERSRPVREERQGEAVLTHILQAEGALGRAGEPAVLDFQPDLPSDGLAGEVAHQGDGPGLLAHAQRARQRQRHLQGLGRWLGTAAHAHPGVAGDRCRRGPPGREVVRQHQVHAGPAIAARGHEGGPVGRVLEVLAHLVVVIGLEVAAFRLFEAPHRALAAQQIVEAPVRRSRAQHAVAARGMEEAHGIGMQFLAQRVDGFVHHAHAEVGGGGLPGGIRDGHRDLHGLAGLVALLVRGDGHGQAAVPLGHADGHLHQLAAALGHDLEHGPDIGLHGRSDGDVHQRRGARHRAALPLAQALMLDGPVQGELRSGQLHEDVGDVAGLVLGLVGGGA